MLLKEAAVTLLEGIRKEDMHFVESIEEMHDNINKFVSYALRMLNKYGYPDVKKTTFYYHIIASIDKIVNILKYNARDILSYKKKFNKETIIIWEHINNSIHLYYEFFYNFDLEKVNNLSKNRDFVKNLINIKTNKIPLEETILITNMK